jgi:hypothetical protein
LRVFGVPHPAVTCSGVNSHVLLKLTDIPLSSNKSIISTLTDAEPKWKDVIFLELRILISASNTVR